MGDTLEAEAEAASLPLLDRAAQARLAAFLPPGDLARHLATLAARAEHLRRMLAAGDLGPECGAAAHAMAGSAGTLGFARLTAAARAFERALEAPGRGAVMDHASVLADVLDLSLPAMRRPLD